MTEEEIRKELDRVDKGMKILDSDTDAKGNPMDEANIERHLDFIKVLLRNICEAVKQEESKGQKFDWNLRRFYQQEQLKFI